MSAIGEELRAAIEKCFTTLLSEDKMATDLMSGIKDGTATFEEAEQYAARVGELLSKAITSECDKVLAPDDPLTKELVEAFLQPLLNQGYHRVTDASARVLRNLCRDEGLNLKPVKPKINADRVEGLIEKAGSYESYSEAKWVFDEPVVNFLQNVCDNLLQENVEAHFEIGLLPKITRKAESGCCKWCAGLADEYEYPVDREVYRRHERCRCTVLYDPGNGKIQNAHTKKIYDNVKTAERDSRIERAQEVVRQNEKRQREKQLLPLIQHPENLRNWTPETLKDYLEKQGFDVKPLARGSFKGIPLEEGGGWKINFGDGGLLQYHPEEKSHHGGAYWKISADGRTRRFNLDGTPKKDRSR